MDLAPRRKATMPHWQDVLAQDTRFNWPHARGAALRGTTQEKR